MIRALPEQLEVDLILPVPLHPSRLRAREFNQSLLLADRLGKYLMRPISTTALVRTVVTEPQTSLTRQERLRNLRRAFTVRHAESFDGRRVLLVGPLCFRSRSLALIAALGFRHDFPFPVRAQSTDSFPF